MMFKEYMLLEGISVRKPLGKLVSKRVIKNRGMVGQKVVNQVQFVTQKGNDVKVQFEVRETVGDVVFYVNDTLDDLGGRSDGSVDPEILGGVLWVVGVYSDKMGLNGLTFSAWSGSGDNKVIRGLDTTKPLEVAKSVIKKYMDRVRGYKPIEIPPSESRIALAAKLGRPLVKVYDVNVGKLLEILGKMLEELNSGSFVDNREFEEMYWMGDGLEKKISGASEVRDALDKYRVALLSQSETGAVVTRNRREDLYARLLDKFFSDKWDIVKKRNQFELTRKATVESVVVERKSLGDKSVYIQKWAEEALQLLRSGNYILCDGLRMSFGKMYGVKCVGRYGEWGFRNVYYFGRVDGLGEWDSARAQGRADIVDAPGMNGRESCVYIASDTIYDEIQSINDKFDGFSVPVGQIEDYDASGMIYALGEHEKRVLYHELSHVYDVMKRGTVGLGKAGNYRWSSRPEELEAELNLVFNSILTDLDSYKYVGEFESKYPLTDDGLRQMSEDYGSQIWAFLGWAKNNPGKVKIEYKKIIRRLVDLRGQIVDKLKKRGDISESVAVRKFSDLMTEMPAWNDANKSVADDLFYYGDERRQVIGGRLKSKFESIDIFKVGDFNCYSWKNSYGQCSVDVFDSDDNKVGEFTWANDGGMWTTESVAVSHDNQGKGIGFGVYKYMIQNVFKTLYSDYSLTGEVGKGSFDLWVKLGKVFPHKYIYNGEEDIAEEVDGFTRDMMGDDNIRFVVSMEDILEDV
jgi:hypothetical protein